MKLFKKNQNVALVTAHIRELSPADLLLVNGGSPQSGLCVPDGHGGLWCVPPPRQK